MNTVNLLKYSMALAIGGLAAAPLSVAQDSDVFGHMHEHYDAIVKIQRAVIAGALDPTREPARWLAEHAEPAGLPAGGEQFVTEMRAAANDVLGAADVATAAEATSRLGLACGHCHLANNVSIAFEEASRPSDKEKTRPHMQRHQWAADRMWEGLIDPSGASWSRGANLLFESPIKPNTLGDDELVAMSRRVHQLAANATTVSDPDEKAAIYAEFIGKCAGCHSELGDGPR